VTRVAALVSEGLPEERLVALLARTAAESAGADLAAVYLQPDHSAAQPVWRLGGHTGGDAEVLSMLPTAMGTGTGVLAPLFQGSREVYEPDLLDDPDEAAVVPHRVPARSLVGLPVRRRDNRVIGALILGANCRDAFDEVALATFRSMAQLLGVGLDNARLAAAQQRERRVAFESQATLGTVLESVDSGICVVELDGSVRVCNKALQDLFGFSGRSAGLPQAEVFAAAATRPSAAEAFMARLRELIDDPSQIDESEWELASEPPRIVQRYSAPLRNQVGEIVGRVDVYTDITESRRLYTQLLNSEKLRAIGEMASGVAHDFNNLLASILGQTELLHPEELPPPAREAFSIIRQSALDGARIVRNLQGLARPRAETPSTTADLNETVQAALDMARPRFAGASLRGQGPVDVQLELADSASLSRVAIDPAELREVLLNLLFNAADAMPEGGGIQITTRPGQKPKTADLIVRDTGHGMPESVRERIFEPFFSTKGPKGSGLGLAVAYSIITRRGGQISVESVMDQGTTFTLTLPYVPFTAAAAAAPSPSPAAAAAPSPSPAAAAAPSPSPAAAAAPSPSPASAAAPSPSPASASPTPPAATAPSPLGSSIRGARILVADDEPGLVAIVRQLMQRSGADVTIAHGGVAALEAVRAAGTRFDVVITDLDMPEVDGWAVAAAVKSHSPSTHVVMLTGWAGDLAPEDFLQRGVDVMLSKPCSRADLEAAISRLLAPPPPKGLEVLLVDDEPAFARAVRDLLRLQGHHVTVVDSAPAALEQTASQRFDAVLTDYSLGEITGADLAKRLAERGSDLFVVLVTGYATEIDDPTLMSQGVNAVVPKPCRGDDLRQVLARVPRTTAPPS
jgi:signal transduction histidine kinase/DNA-binding response OmpR family regulator